MDLIILAFQGIPLGGSGGPEKDRMFLVFVVTLRSLSSDSSGQLDVFRHDGYSSGVDGTEVGVLEQPHQVCF